MQQVSLETADSKPTLNTGFMVALGVLALAVVVLYLSAFKGLVQLWWESDDYFYGFFVIPFSLFLAWDRREMLEEIGGVFKGSWWGLAVVLAATAAHWYGAYHYYFSIEAMTIAPTVLGIVLLVGGWKAIRWLWPSILFLALMVPLPSRYATLLRGPLQEIATKSSVFILQTLGIPAVIQGAGGNVIVLPGDLRIGVVEACSGIRMLMLFFAACIGTALIIRRDAVTRTIVVFSAIPIAIISNVLRITSTAILYVYVSQELGEKIFHDLAGWFLMPTAIILLLIELAILGKLFTPPERKAPLALGPMPLDRGRNRGRGTIPGVRPPESRRPPEEREKPE